MAETVLIGELELDNVTDISVQQARKLVGFEVTGWEGDVLQDMGSSLAEISLRGMALGEDAGERLEGLRRRYADGEPHDFVSSASVGTDIAQAVIASLDVVQSGRVSNGYLYAMKLRQYIPPPPPMLGGFDVGFLEDLTSLEDALALENVGALADALGTAQEGLNKINEAVEFVEEAVETLGALGDISEFLEAAAGVVSASE